MRAAGSSPEGEQGSPVHTSMQARPHSPGLKAPAQAQGLGPQLAAGGGVGGPQFCRSHPRLARCCTCPGHLGAGRERQAHPHKEKAPQTQAQDLGCVKGRVQGQGQELDSTSWGSALEGGLGAGMRTLGSVPGDPYGCVHHPSGTRLGWCWRPAPLPPPEPWLPREPHSRPPAAPMLLNPSKMYWSQRLPQMPSLCAAPSTVVLVLMTRPPRSPGASLRGAAWGHTADRLGVRVPLAPKEGASRQQSPQPVPQPQHGRWPQGLGRSRPGQWCWDPGESEWRPEGGGATGQPIPAAQGPRRLHPPTSLAGGAPGPHNQSPFCLS